MKLADDVFPIAILAVVLSMGSVFLGSSPGPSGLVTLTRQEMKTVTFTLPVPEKGTTFEIRNHEGKLLERFTPFSGIWWVDDRPCEREDDSLPPVPGHVAWGGSAQ